MKIKADLHMHTSFSDGVFSPKELIQKCNSKNLNTISITDHDSTESFNEAAEEAKIFNMEIIPGVELSATDGVKEYHILGYFIDFNNQRLKDYLTFFRLERVRRAERIVEKLNKLKIPLKFDSVLQKAKGGAIGRPHIAMALVDEKFISNYQEAFEKLIGNNCPAYEKKFVMSPEQTIQLISSAGGLSFLAHPGRQTSSDMLQSIISAGVDGIEVIHPSHTIELTNHYQNIVSQYFLLGSGGSDFHGGRRNDDTALGNYFVDSNSIEAMKRRLFSNKVI
ncbi:MAG: PHP domain-containing protein [Bacteroidetes bacterium]|nr:PHP domain-containing protein [Bacteroidota bacterium]